MSKQESAFRDEDVPLLVEKLRLEGVSLTDVEVQLVLREAQARNLDPVRGQILVQKRKDRNGLAQLVMSMPIDVYRARAEQHPDYQGQTPPQWCDGEGRWHDVWIFPGAPMAARVGIRRARCVEPFWGVATMDAFRGVGPWWNSKGGGGKAHMLAIRAESLAIRKAFPTDLGGTYTSEEMQGVVPEPVQALETEAAPEMEKPNGKTPFMSGRRPRPPLKGMKKPAVVEELAEHKARLPDETYREICPDRPKTLLEAKAILDELRRIPTPPPEEELHETPWEAAQDEATL